MSLDRTIGRVIYESRISSKKSQRQLARDMNVPRTYISKIEGGKATPTLRSLETFAAGLGLKVSQLIRLAEEAPDKPIEKKPTMPQAMKPRVNKNAVPKGALVSHSFAMEHRREIGRALGTLPKETR